MGVFCDVKQSAVSRATSRGCSSAVAECKVNSVLLSLEAYSYTHHFQVPSFSYHKIKRQMLEAINLPCLCPSFFPPLPNLIPNESRIYL